jgi:hypothetical protein
VNTLATGAFFYQADITSRASLKAAADLIRVEHGDPTVLVNNAGVGKDGTILEESEDDIRCTLEVNILSHFWTTKEFLPAMLKSSHGHVITIASVASFVAFGQAVDYCVSKAGALAFHEALTQEIRGFYGSEKIRTRYTSFFFSFSNFLARQIPTDMSLKYNSPNMDSYTADRTPHCDWEIYTAGARSDRRVPSGCEADREPK